MPKMNTKERVETPMNNPNYGVSQEGKMPSTSWNWRGRRDEDNKETGIKKNPTSPTVPTARK
ncbi:hypothetical protein KBB48_03195 [Candidatus Shapirobacteria bacterium]|nr:hypothetical protein [Candidatus Shapirobacteria bacterium]